MKQSFKFGQRVEIVSGFYQGHVGKVIEERKVLRALPFLPPRRVYKVISEKAEQIGPFFRIEWDGLFTPEQLKPKDTTLVATAGGEVKEAL